MTENSDRGWNSSTMCLQVLHRSMTEQQWGARAPRIPMYDNEFPNFDYELPQRPPDLGVGLWR